PIADRHGEDLLLDDGVSGEDLALHFLAVYDLAAELPEFEAQLCILVLEPLEPLARQLVRYRAILSAFLVVRRRAAFGLRIYPGFAFEVGLFLRPGHKISSSEESLPDILDLASVFSCTLALPSCDSPAFDTREPHLLPR